SNQPKLRLQQYQQLVQHAPQWPQALQTILLGWQAFPADFSTGQFRQRAQLPQLRKAIAMDLMGAKIPQGKLDTIFCDALLPLAEAACLLDAYAYWLHWPAPNCPQSILNCIRQAQLASREQPLSNGLVQGLLALAMRH
ncbi:MAG: hypothetical protein ACPGF8_05295, partial [Opitutales bacterium]